jgi:hypothetical protein
MLVKDYLKITDDEIEDFTDIVYYENKEYLNSAVTFIEKCFGQPWKSLSKSQQEYAKDISDKIVELVGK